MTAMLGTRLRHLSDLLDGAVEAAYRDAGLEYRPRYTPVVKALSDNGPATIRAIAREAGVTHSAASQTVAQMARQGLVSLSAGADARERVVALTGRAQAMLPTLRTHWVAADAAAAELDAELSAPLSAVLADALAALARRPFAERLEAARLGVPA